MPCQECFWELIGLLKAVIGVFSLPLWTAIPILIFWSLWRGCCHSAQQTDMDFLHRTVSCQLLCFCGAGCCLWRLPLLLSARLTPLRSVLGLCAKGWRGSLHFSVTARTRVRKWGCWVQHLTLLSRPFILQGTSSEEMELKVKISCFVLAAEPQISSFLSYCLTFCLCLCYRNRANGLLCAGFLLPLTTEWQSGSVRSLHWYFLCSC